MSEEKWYKRDDVEYWKKEYLELSKQLEEKEIVLDKIKEEVEYWGYEEEYNDDRIFCNCMKKIHELLEEIE